MEDVSLAAMPDGMSLGQWTEAKGISKSAAYELLRLVEAMGVPIQRMRIGAATKPSPLLAGRSLEAIDALFARYQAGHSLKQLAAEIQSHASESSAITPASSTAIEAQVDGHEDREHDSAELLARLQAAQLAQQTGLPLTRKELSWILGSQPTTSFSTNAPIRIQKDSVLGWSIHAPA